MKKKLALVLCLIVCVSACFACVNKEYWGVYKEQANGDMIRTYYLELKSGGKCEYYGLKGNEKKEDIKQEKLEYFEGTYKIEDKTISLYIVNTNTHDNATEEWVGTILSNGNISLPQDGGPVRVFKKQ